MPWLGTWAKRVKLTIDNSDIDAVLTDFPVLVYLSSSSGRNGDDVTAVFDEVGANSLKIAVTACDGETQRYVEVEQWDSGNEKAWLWVKVPSIASGADTILYLYYDNAQADNTTYVGIPNSVPAENVWDANFLLVDHLRDDPDTSSTRDSTSHDYDGVKQGAANPNVVSSQIAQGQNYDNDGYINYGNTTNPTTHITIELWIRFDGDEGAGYDMWIDKNYTNQLYGRIYNTNVRLALKIGGVLRHATNAPQTAGVWHHVTFVYDGSDIITYNNGAVVNPLVAAVGALDTDTNPLYLGTYAGQTGGVYNIDGELDEFRISDSPRPAAWVKATYETTRDDLLDFGAEVTRQEWLAFAFCLPVKPRSIHCVQGGTLRFMDIGPSKFKKMKQFFGIIPFAYTGNLFLEAEFGILSGTADIVDLGDDSGESARLNAQNETVDYTVTAGTHLPEGRYIALFRIKDTAQEQGDVELSVYNSDDSVYRNQENDDVHRTVTAAFLYYGLIFDITNEDVTGTDAIRLRVKKDTANANTIYVDYFVIVPTSNGENWPMDHAHNALRTLMKKPIVQREM